ncbi:MAG: NAD(P)H-hydrate dehydratase [Haemophilus parainfluenzae]|jgi:YjeF C-terminal domain protein|nr:MAG: NAD(P)H-hydrate dehydratase [Haemophilus parainfluenzae]
MLFNREWLKEYIPDLFRKKKEDINKGSNGSLALVGGALTMQGSLLLAGESALKSGCGKVFLFFVSSPPEVALSFCPELMMRTAASFIDTPPPVTAWALGCGLGKSKESRLFLTTLLTQAKESTLPRVLDADALNLIAELPNPPKLGACTVLTPHPGEAARLLDTTVEAIQADREGAVYALCQRFEATVVLKGHHTLVVTQGEKEIYRNPTGNAALATAGTGDVLTGVIGSLMAQGFTPLAAAKAGVFLHGLAADGLVARGIGPMGVLASELSSEIRYWRNLIAYER